jgi:WD40 repeat protein
MLLTLEVCSYLNPYKIINAHTALVTSVKISNDGTFFISGSQDYKVKVWSTSTWSTLHT